MLNLSPAVYKPTNIEYRCSNWDNKWPLRKWENGKLSLNVTFGWSIFRFPYDKKKKLDCVLYEHIYSCLDIFSYFGQFQTKIASRLYMFFINISVVYFIGLLCDWRRKRRKRWTFHSSSLFVPLFYTNWFGIPMTLNPDEQFPQKRNAAMPQRRRSKLGGLRQICRCPMTEPLYSKIIYITVGRRRG